MVEQGAGACPAAGIAVVGHEKPKSGVVVNGGHEAGRGYNDRCGWRQANGR